MLARGRPILYSVDSEFCESVTYFAHPCVDGDEVCQWNCSERAAQPVLRFGRCLHQSERPVLWRIRPRGVKNVISLTLSIEQIRDKCRQGSVFRFCRVFEFVDTRKSMDLSIERHLGRNGFAESADLTVRPGEELPYGAFQVELDGAESDGNLSNDVNRRVVAR